MVRHYVSLVLLAILTMVCSGCSMKIHKDYAFTSPEYRLKYGVIRAKLRGTMGDLDNETSVNQAPYELLLWFSSDDSKNVENCTVALDFITLDNLESGQRIDIPGMNSASFKPKSDGTFVAFMNYKSLDLEFAGHELGFTFSYNSNCALVDSPISVRMEFQKSYSERKIFFWDTLMGV